MAALIKKNFRLWGYGKALALFAGCLLFSVSGRINDGICYEQHILSAVSDHYYLTYFFLPVLLLGCFPFLEDDGENVILRFQSYPSYFYRKWLGAGLIALLLIAVQSAAVLLSGIGLARGNGWALSPGAVGEELFFVLRQYFSTPVQAFAAFSAWQLCGSWIIIGFCMWIGHFGGRKWPTRIILAFYMLSVLWMKLPAVRSLPLTGFNHLLILHHNLGTHHRFAVTGITVWIFAILITVTVRFGWRGHIASPRPQISGITAYYIRELAARRKPLVLCAVVLVIALYKLGAGFRLQSGQEWVFSLFAGHGTGCFRVLPFLEMLIANGAPLYLLAVFVEQAVSGQSFFITVRADTRRKLMRGILSAGAGFLAVYALLWFTAGFLGLFFFGYGGGIPWKMLLFAVFMKFFDTMGQYLIMMCVYAASGQVTIGFLVITAGNLLCIVPGKWGFSLPFGLSSLTRIAEFNPGAGIPAAAALGTEAVVIILTLLWLLTFGSKKILN
ncbi:hypothetical protein [Eisenbergiella sp.]